MHRLCVYTLCSAGKDTWRTTNEMTPGLVLLLSVPLLNVAVTVHSRCRKFCPKGSAQISRISCFGLVVLVFLFGIRSMRSAWDGPMAHQTPIPQDLDSITAGMRDTSGEPRGWRPSYLWRRTGLVKLGVAAIAAYCRCPDRLPSIQAVEIHRANGFRAVCLEDGIQDWRTMGLPFAAGEETK